MSFLEKIGIKHKDDTSDIPPPPPLPKADDKEEPAQPKNERASAPDIQDLPSRKPLPDVPTHPKEKELPELPTSDLPSKQEIEQTLKKSAPEPEQKPAPKPSEKKKSLSRDDLRKAFDDVPPIKSPAAAQPEETHIADDAVQNFNVDDFVLPGDDQKQKEEEAPAPAATRPAPSASRKPAAPEIYISVDTYDDIQKRVNSLRKQISEAGKQIDSILAEREQEDESFSVFIKDLESIQEDLIKIDEDLFTRQ